jgi:hypothetical protein
MRKLTVTNLLGQIAKCRSPECLHFVLLRMLLPQSTEPNHTA